MLDLRIIADGQAFSPEGLSKAIGEARAASEIGAVIEHMIGLLDRLQGDPDLEGIDEREPDDDDKGDVSWPEWHTRGRRKVVDRLAGFNEPVVYRDGVGMAHEDDEDDDPREANGDEHDTGNAEDDELSGDARWMAGYANGGAPGCPISDPAGDEDADRGGYCADFGKDQTRPVSECEAFHDLNDIPLIRVPLPENDQ